MFRYSVRVKKTIFDYTGVCAFVYKKCKQWETIVKLDE